MLSHEFRTAVDLKARTVTFENFKLIEIRYLLARDQPETTVWLAFTMKSLAGRAKTGVKPSDSSARYWGINATRRSESEDKLGGWTSEGFTSWRESGWKISSPGFGGKK
jgi:hypothetical protein